MGVDFQSFSGFLCFPWFLCYFVILGFSWVFGFSAVNRYILRLFGRARSCVLYRFWRGLGHVSGCLLHGWYLGGWCVVDSGHFSCVSFAFLIWLWVLGGY